MKVKVVILGILKLMIIHSFTVSVFAQNVESGTVSKWLVDTSHSNVGFMINHLFTPVHGTFDSYSSNIFFDPDNLENSHITVEIDVSSINTRNERRDNDLRSSNFFDVEKHPAIVFKSETIKKVDENNFVVNGKITIKGIAKEIILPFELLGMSDHYRLEGYKMAGITAETSLKRTDFNVGTGDWVRTNIVADDVIIEIALELASKKI